MSTAAPAGGLGSGDCLVFLSTLLQLFFYLYLHLFYLMCYNITKGGFAVAIKIKLSDFLGRYKMTQKELSFKTGIRPGTISALYHETIKRLEIDHIEKLCEALDCQPGDLFEYVAEK